MGDKHGGDYDPKPYYGGMPSIPAEPHGGSHDPPARNQYYGGPSIPAQPHGGAHNPPAPGQYHGGGSSMPAQPHGGAFNPPPRGQSTIQVREYSPTPHTPQSVPSPGPAYQPQVNPMAYSTIQPSGQYEPKQPLVTQSYAPVMAQPQPYATQGATYGYAQAPAQEGILSKSITTTQSAAVVNELQPSSQKEFPMNLKTWTHIFGPQKLTWRWRFVNFVKLPGYQYTSTKMFRHRDFAGRVKEGPMEDRYLHHEDGSLRKLIVATSDKLFEGADNTTWRRTYIRMVSPLRVRIATWVIDFSYDPKSWDDWWVMLLRALPAAFATSLFFWDGESDRWQFEGCYAPVPYWFHGDAKVWSNHLENRVGTSLLARNNDVYRLLKPRHLCFLRNPGSDQMFGADARSVADWEATDGVSSDASLSYLFVAYSTEHFSHDSEEDRDALHLIAETAARAAKIPAYWVAVSCMRDKRELESDVFRISDVLRGAKKMIIAVGQGKKSASSQRLTTDELLAQWGSRMWTFPEVLLSPEREIAVYRRGGDLGSPLRVSKNQFAGRVWGAMDAEQARQLIDHYLGNLSLSRLELAVTALKCLYNRYTTEHFSGDQAYALMGLLRLRPQVDSTDTPFQAFARLSLANDSDKLLERYLCTLPVNPTQPWFDMSDQYNSQLWDIEPRCQVAGICGEDTVILDGARGASIRWKSFFPVGFTTKLSWKRWFAVFLMQNNGLVFLAAIIVLAVSARNPVAVLIGVLLLLLALGIWLQSPMLIRTTYGGKLSSVQAALFGFEGYVNAPAVERSLFGGCFNRVGWSLNGSPLSRSVINEHGERVGVDPTKDPAVRQLVEEARYAKPGDLRVFTLVDTYSMEMTLFRAARPPTCVLLCGAEGGMQRAVACSYDWTTQTMHRETVLRMPTTALNRMDRAPRVRVGLRRHEMESRPVAVAADGGAAAVAVAPV